ALKLTAELGLPRDRLDHRAEDVANADAGAEGAEADAEREADRLAGFGHVAGGGGEKNAHGSLLVLGLDCRADVDGGQGSEDERLDPDHDHDLEEVEGDRRDQDGQQLQGLEDEDKSEEREDQDVAGEHVREEPDAERDQAHELAEHLERDDQQQQSLRRLGNPALEVAHGAVPADAFEVREDERQQRERERDRERRGGRVDPPDRKGVPGLAGDRERDEPDQVDHEDEQQQRGDVRNPAGDRLRRKALLGDLHLGDFVDLFADRLAFAAAGAHQPKPEQDRQSGADEEVDDRLGDRQVDRAEVDRDPLVLLELRRRVEFAPRQRGGRQAQYRERHDCEGASHARGSWT